MVPVVLVLQAILVPVSSFSVSGSRSSGSGSRATTSIVNDHHNVNNAACLSFQTPMTLNQRRSTTAVAVPVQLQSLSNNKRSISSSSSPLFMQKTTASDDNDDDDVEEMGLPTYGGLIGTLTGISLSAIRQSFRTTTGLSLTATRTALRGLTGVSVTASMRMLFGVFPPWFRYFLQPFFILYYTPLMIVKCFLLGSTKTSKEEALAAHEKVIEGWKDAIRAAEQMQEYFPLHVSDEGKIESLTPHSTPMTDAIVESLDIASTIQNKN